MPFAPLLAFLLAVNPVNDFNAAIAAENRGDFAAAAVLLDRAQAALPGWSLPKIELADVLLREGGAADRALGLLGPAARLDPQNPRLYYLQGVALAEKGDISGAEAAERAALFRRPDFPDAEATLAQDLWDQGKRDEALGHWRALAERLPFDTSRRALLIDRLLDSGHPIDAERELRRLAVEQPKNPVWHRRLARALEAQGLLAEAAAEREKASVLSGDRPPQRKLRRLPDSKR